MCRKSKKQLYGLEPDGFKNNERIYKIDTRLEFWVT